MRCGLWRLSRGGVEEGMQEHSQEAHVERGSLSLGLLSVGWWGARGVARTRAHCWFCGRRARREGSQPSPAPGCANDLSPSARFVLCSFLLELLGQSISLAAWRCFAHIYIYIYMSRLKAPFLSRVWVANDTQRLALFVVCTVAKRPCAGDVVCIYALHGRTEVAHNEERRLAAS